MGLQDEINKILLENCRSWKNIPEIIYNNYMVKEENKLSIIYKNKERYIFKYRLSLLKDDIMFGWNIGDYVVDIANKDTNDEENVYHHCILIELPGLDIRCRDKIMSMSDQDIAYHLGFGEMQEVYTINISTKTGKIEPNKYGYIDTYIFETDIARPKENYLIKNEFLYLIKSMVDNGNTDSAYKFATLVSKVIGTTQLHNVDERIVDLYTKFI